MTQGNGVRPLEDNGVKISNGNEKTLAAQLNGHENEENGVSKLRQAVPQCFAVGAKNLLLLTFGTTLGYSTILLPELEKSDAEIKVDLEQLSWISSLNLFLVPVGCVVSGPLTQYFGRKKMMMVTNIPFMIGWMIFYKATSSWMLFIALAITGLTGGLLEAPVMTYVAEVTQPHLRGMLSATSTMTVILGIFSQMLGGSLTDWRTIALINLSYPILCFFALCCVPESPHWLAAKGRLKESEEALCWLRGWVPPSQVSKEFHQIGDIVRKPKTNTEKQSLWKSVTQPTVWKPFLVVTLAFFVGSFGGVNTLQTFAVIIFANLKAPIDKYKATVILGIGQLVGTMICVITIHFLGKRKLTFISIGGTGLCFLLAAFYGYLHHNQLISNINRTSIIGTCTLFGLQSKLNLDLYLSYSWIPSTLMVGAAFLAHIGIRLLPWVLAGEVFPVEIRSTAVGAAGSIGYIFNSVANKTFLYMMTGITLAGTFFFYALTNCVCGIVLYYTLPETEGRTLKEIEEHYAGIQSLENRPKTNEIQSMEKWAATNPTLTNDDNESKL